MQELIQYRVSLSSLASALPRRSTIFNPCDDLARGIRIGENRVAGQSLNGKCQQKSRLAVAWNEFARRAKEFVV